MQIYVELVLSVRSGQDFLVKSVNYHKNLKSIQAKLFYISKYISCEGFSQQKPLSLSQSIISSIVTLSRKATSFWAYFEQFSLKQAQNEVYFYQEQKLLYQPKHFYQKNAALPLFKLDDTLIHVKTQVIFHRKTSDNFPQNLYFVDPISSSRKVEEIKNC